MVSELTTHYFRYGVFIVPTPLLVPRDVSEVTDMRFSFYGATTFSHTLCWEVLYGTETIVRYGTATYDMFTNSGGSIDPSCVYHCNPKKESEWAALGCMISSGPEGLLAPTWVQVPSIQFKSPSPKCRTNLFFHLCAPS